MIFFLSHYKNDNKNTSYEKYKEKLKEYIQIHETAVIKKLSSKIENKTKKGSKNKPQIVTEISLKKKTPQKKNTKETNKKICLRKINRN